MSEVNSMSEIFYRFKSKGGFNRKVKLYMLNTFISYLVMSAFSNVLQGIYFKALGFEEGFIGNVIAVKTIITGLSAIPIGMVSDMIGRRNAVMLGVIVSNIGFLGQSICMSQPLIYAFACLTGAGSAAMYVNDAPFLAENCEEEKRINLFSINFVITNLAFIAGSFAAGKMPEILGSEAVSSLRYSQIAFALLGFISLIPLSKIKNEKLKPGKSSVKGFFDLLKNKKIILILIYNMIIGFGAGLVVPFFNIFLQYKLKAGTGVVGTIMAYSQLATVIGAFLVPYVAKKFGRANTVQLCQVLSIPFLLTISVAGSVWLITFVFFMRSALMNMAHPVIQNLTMEIVEDDKRSALSSLISLSNYITRGISASVAGYIMANISYELPYYITAVLYLVAIAIFSMVFGKKRSNLQ